MREDPILGLVRLCGTCHEEWPFDPEFWHLVDGELSPAWPHRCIACCAEYFAARRRLNQQIVKAERAFLVPDRHRCGTELQTGQYCGRQSGHRRSHRSVEAMRSDARRKAAARHPVAA